MNFKRYKNDILLVLAVLLLAGILYGARLLLRRQGGEAVVTVDGTQVAVLPLNEDAELVLAGADFGLGGDDTNTVVVRDGRVCVTDANCPDKICEHQGWIEYGGESIVCLPHRLVVTVRGAQSSVDAAAR